MDDWLVVAELIKVPHYNRYCRHTIRGYAANFVNNQGEYVYYDSDLESWCNSLSDKKTFLKEVLAYIDLIEGLLDGDSN